MADEFLAMLQGMDPDKAQAMAAKLRGQDLFGKVYASSLTPNAQRLGQADQADAMGKTKFIGLARAKKAAQEEADRIQADRWGITDQQLEDQRAQAQENWEEQLAFDREKMEAQSKRKLARQEMKTQETMKETRKEVTAMSKEFTKANVPQLDSAFIDLDKVLTPYMNEDGSLKANIPGAGATGIGPQMFLSKEGREVRSVVANVRNQVMKMMSGAAVTDPEAARLYEQIGQFLGGSDEDILFGLQGIRNIADRNRGNIEAGFSDNAIAEYQRRLTGRGEPSTTQQVMGDALSYLDPEGS